ncbi:SCO family protein [Solirubrobacter sp. CPCC 204708]|uniref:SCO family protein n=1 Tax=Solirubrobacter deserti TaxID=2282478 RepID=A0ABT4RF82_9ACTN|nr:SCO family protein [Solirubrobacter deserti]MBE2319519.1 SCO family protein [Solirubrobacter deserti]MDA0137194.1 SCO family protein [Solirubrobacter deserti]
MALLHPTERPQPAPAAPPRRRLLLLALMCLVLGALGGAWAATATRTEPVQTRFVPPREAAFDFTLRDQDGRPARLADARGRVVALTFIYASCRDLCPAEGNDVASAMDLVGGDDVVAYIVSVDPVGDTPERARAWIDRRGLGGRGRYLLGTRDQLRPVWIHYGIAPMNATRAESIAAAARADAFRAANPPNRSRGGFRYEPPPQPAQPPPGADDPYPDTADLAYRGRARHIAGWDFEHSAYVLLIDKRGEQRLGIPFESLDPRSLAQDLRALVAEPV